MDILRFMGLEGELEDLALPEEITDKDLLEIFSNAVFLRTFDERAVALQRQGRIGTYPPFWGEEGIQAGPVHAAQETDWLFPSYRQSAVGILRGLPASTIYRYRRGYGGEYGFWNARDYRVAPMTVAIATQLPHAVGLAWAAKLRDDPIASLVWFGDGATSEGDFHEALNFASVHKVPCVFFCTNNQWAISTPVTKQMATETVAEKAAAYAIPGVRVDGFDPVACWKAASDALKVAREGGGPTLIEAFCYRLAPHGTADDPGRYRDETITDNWRRLEPVSRMGAYLKRLGVLDDASEEAVFEDARSRIAQAVVELEAIEPPGHEIMFEHVYGGTRPPGFDDNLAELEATKRSAGSD